MTVSEILYLLVSPMIVTLIAVTMRHKSFAPSWFTAIFTTLLFGIAVRSAGSFPEPPPGSETPLLGLTLVYFVPVLAAFAAVRLTFVRDHTLAAILIGLTFFWLGAMAVIILGLAVGWFTL